MDTVWTYSRGFKNSKKERIHRKLHWSHIWRQVVKMCLNFNSLSAGNKQEAGHILLAQIHKTSKIVSHNTMSFNKLMPIQNYYIKVQHHFKTEG